MSMTRLFFSSGESPTPNVREHHPPTTAPRDRSTIRRVGATAEQPNFNELEQPRPSSSRAARLIYYPTRRNTLRPT